MVELISVEWHPETWEEFVEFWKKDKIRFCEEEVFEDEKGKKWYRMYNKPTLEYLREKMLRDIEYLKQKTNE